MKDDVYLEAARRNKVMVMYTAVGYSFGSAIGINGLISRGETSIIAWGVFSLMAFFSLVLIAMYVQARRRCSRLEELEGGRQV